VVRKQEAKKERIIGGVNSTKNNRNQKVYQSTQANSIHSKRKMKILPQHLSQ